MVAQHHFGVYARIRDAGRILLVRKTRGPYAGLLDLPGGQPEPGESWAETLERELHEELGVRLPVAGEFTEFSLQVRRTSTGRPIDFRHRGVFADLPAPADLPATVQSPDTDGVEWFDLRAGDRARLSTLVGEVLRR
ncbi:MULTISPECIES: NUDIX domain-containing protein [Kribbella]|uniref:Nudix hydrolase domain-containing protein n=1 Tax=Kribbella karoonensis TaxID=324851 RepID=A0ABN2DL78_9ACTN